MRDAGTGDLEMTTYWISKVIQTKVETDVVVSKQSTIRRTVDLTDSKIAGVLWVFRDRRDAIEHAGKNGVIKVAVK